MHIAVDLPLFTSETMGGTVLPSKRSTPVPKQARGCFCFPDYDD